MNSIITILAASNPERVPPMLVILFWILLILCFLGNIGVGFVAAENPNRVRIVQGTGIVGLILFAILGYAQFGF